jgi:hypothetical protein
MGYGVRSPVETSRWDVSMVCSAGRVTPSGRRSRLRRGRVATLRPAEPATSLKGGWGTVCKFRIGSVTPSARRSRAPSSRKEVTASILRTTARRSRAFYILQQGRAERPTSSPLSNSRPFVPLPDLRESSYTAEPEQHVSTQSI